MAVMLTGSGTAAVESAVMSSLRREAHARPQQRRLWRTHLHMIGLHRLGVSELKSEWHIKPDPETVRLALRQHPEVHAVAMVHHETTTGLINPIKEIAEVVDSQNRVFVVDSVSGLGGRDRSILPVRTSIWWRARRENAFKVFLVSRSSSSARDFWSGCEGIPSDRGIST